MVCPLQNAVPGPRWEVADIFRRHGQEYREQYSLSGPQLKAMTAMVKCRTPAMGGRLERCNVCDHEHLLYNSCGNRHCPKCQFLAKAKWVEARYQELLPVPYFHLVFTLPHELNGLAFCNQRVIYKLLFQSAQDTLLQFGRNPDNGLGGLVGGFSMLHTWTQQLTYHVHLHIVMAGGALSDDGKIWIHSSKKFLFPVMALSQVFRGKFLDGLLKAHGKTPLRCPDAEPGEEFAWHKTLIRELYQQEWVVYAKAPFNGVTTALEYLSRYTHRVAISNNRILDYQDGQVTVSYRDRAHNNQKKKMTISAVQFMHRFLLHVVPDHFMRIRHFGFLANRCRKVKLAQCRKIFGIPDPQAKSEKKSMAERVKSLTGTDPAKCPCCTNGKMVTVRKLLPQIPTPFQSYETKSAGWNTS